ncbi:carbamoyl-phosphate synthase (glutamine-hydrolyzing) large subunit [Pyrobaculum neutrophilum]|uniref:Carbamoyl phosphate synthase large chain n=1 Tax=Pyrobaculum neutrophilum (strain DSM 2338 / JCM 9278 / NBRC 100436 / V24Sta) TaxID=444157 RepID=B1YAL3_PYRNV|nr:carbamoyl-phosphate synthase (glutamine-hydrolyzing) large subunit [Pyrobaculum neutrophilum]ACB39092.1 carbamoyl-phosphate synthase, large subunit [Pyrobaculum neutrophilum V24Sta]
MPDVRKILVVGSGAIKVAEAAEFDYSGSQALKAFREEGIETVLVNPNIATIQTSKLLADKVYFVPIQRQFLAEVIERERPDAIACGFGGQTALSACVDLHDSGVLDKYGVKVVGTPVRGIKRALSRDLFQKAMREVGIPIPPSSPARSPEEALKVAREIGYPVVVRVSFNLGGAGAFVARSEEDLRARVYKAFAQSAIGEVLVEKYLEGWKEVEFEVVRDAYDNVAAVVCMENIDPMGVHTGDSIVVAPCLTLTDEEYQTARNISIGVARAIELVGEGNVQVAVNYAGPEQYAIETNPRMSRSSALASKASGYPLAFIAAKLALGYRLDEVLNQVTRRTVAAFEPALDYIVVKHPRWENDRFGVSEGLGPEMMSIGEAMAVGRTLEEAWQKAVRMIDIGEPGLVGGPMFRELTLEEARRCLEGYRPYWPICAAKAMYLGLSIDEVYSYVKVDRFFLRAIQRVVEAYKALEQGRYDLEELKVLGFSDGQIARALGVEEEEVRRARRRPVVKRIDTLAGEWPAETNYLYLTYGGVYDDDVPRVDYLVVGAGVFRIGVSVEFDWSTVNLAQELRNRGFKVAILNYNPETVSTDWDIVDKLYFDEISSERILDIVEKEGGGVAVVLYAGGQIGQRLYKRLEAAGVKIGGTRAASIDAAEDRSKFSELLEKLGIKQPPWFAARSPEEAAKLAEALGYPVLVRPSYVLGGTYMAVAYDREELLSFLTKAARVSGEYPAVVSKFMPRGVEAEVDAVSDGVRLVATPIEHVEPPGVHSGDSTMVLPPRRLEEGAVKKMVEATQRIAAELGVKGPLNVQFIVYDDVYVIEANLRVSRSMPFVSKATGVNYMSLTADVLVNGRLAVDEEVVVLKPTKWWVKSPQFSWSRLRGSYPRLGPVMYSTGEVASNGATYEEALLKSWLSAAPNRIPERSALIYTYDKHGAEALGQAASLLAGRLEVHTPESLGEKAVEMLKWKKIDIVMTSGVTPERDFHIRRTAADTNTPLVLDASLALELAKAFTWYYKNGKLEVAPW